MPQPASDQHQDEQKVEGAPDRPGLYIVDPNTAPPTGGEDQTAAPAEPAVKPLAPWDQRIAQAISDLVEARPRWNEQPPSYAQTWAYSRAGDWTTSSNQLVRAVHAALTLAALAMVFPLDWLANVIRDKPSGFVITVVVVVLLALAI
ncbi:hypothetical protein [Pseudonocardia sp. ICBG1293]|uniref:hypothetical protein n=1 Tax=Pseudonocardia sp. ICBG1293 TaxID=2844382 RepID=UPI001CC90EE0|nr:hypothetical protein [Pseudonocardia sp. ICBG1293]